MSKSSSFGLCRRWNKLRAAIRYLALDNVKMRMNKHGFHAHFLFACDYWWCIAETYEKSPQNTTQLLYNRDTLSWFNSFHSVPLLCVVWFILLSAAFIRAWAAILLVFERTVCVILIVFIDYLLCQQFSLIISEHAWEPLEHIKNDTQQKHAHAFAFNGERVKKPMEKNTNENFLSSFFYWYCNFLPLFSWDMNLLSIDDWIFQLGMYAKSDSFISHCSVFIFSLFSTIIRKHPNDARKKVWNKLRAAWKFLSRFQFYIASLPLKQFQRKLHWITLEDVRAVRFFLLKPVFIMAVW